MLLLHRDQQPNIGRYSPVGGKVEVASGEGPHECAVREVREETGITLDHDDLRLTGIVSERAYQDEAHWLIFLFEAVAPLAADALKWTRFKEGTLEWKRTDEVAGLPIPRTDRDDHVAAGAGASRGVLHGAHQLVRDRHDVDGARVGQKGRDSGGWG